MSGLLVQTFHLNGDSYYYSLDKYLCLTPTLTWESHIIIMWIVGSVIGLFQNPHPTTERMLENLTGGGGEVGGWTALEIQTGGGLWT